MNNRVTRTNDMHLFILEARLHDAVEVMRKASGVADYVEAVGEMQRARQAYNKRRAMFRPRRVRKAEQRAKAEYAELCPAAAYMEEACTYLNAKPRGPWFYAQAKYGRWRRDYIAAARHFRTLATYTGRKLP